MGASGWHYYAPYQENIEQAFQELRHNIFTSGKYFQFWRIARSYRIALGGRDETEMDAEELMRVLDESEHMQVTPPETIEEALEWSEGQGTHSILDISHLITEPIETYIKVPLPDDMYQRFLATKEPDRDIIEAIVRESTIWGTITKWIEHTRESLAMNSHISSTWSQEVLQFFEVGCILQEMIDALITFPKIWAELHRHIVSYISQIVREQIQDKAFPFSEEAQIRSLGTDRPTKQDFEIALDQREIWYDITRYPACYAIIYKDDKPDEIIFIGISGD